MLRLAARSFGRSESGAVSLLFAGALIAIVNMRTNAGEL